MNAQATWYFDFVSPFAYLQWRKLQRLAVSGMAYRPILFAGLLNRLGHKGPAEIPAKRIFTYRHVTWRAERDGVPLTFPRAHPFNPLPALRLCIAAGTTTEAIDVVFRYLWEEGRSTETAGEVDELARRLGFQDAAAPLADDCVKAVLRENFDRALEDGVFGVPTIVCDHQIFWGDDATGMFLDYIRDPDRFNSGEMVRVTQLPVGATRPQATHGAHDRERPDSMALNPPACAWCAAAAADLR
ncbi:MAG: hypothetical protein RL684_775 [Pseudomonadota bacterium]